MKSKTPLVLMEQLVMILVFALAAALCLQAFAASDRISRENEQRSQAALLAQNAAETLKAWGGNLEEAARHLGGEASAQEWTIFYDQNGEALVDEIGFVYRLEIRETEPPVTGLGQAEVSVFRSDEEALFALQVAWGVE